VSATWSAVRGNSWAAAVGELLEPADLPAWMEKHTRVVKRDTHSCVGSLSVKGRHCFLKYYRCKSLLQRLQFRLGRGRAVNSFDNARALRASGLEVPEPLACLRVPDGMLLLAEGIEHGADLKSLWLEGQADARLEQLMQHAGAALAALHNAGFSHGDCKWSNFLVAGERMYLIDLEAVSICNKTGQECARDLARFTLNAEDMGLSRPLYDAFLGTYAEAMGILPGDVTSRMAPRLSRLRQRHLEKYGQRGHQLV
jgi:tRNA A-37 threonylcarbamoyl transferase component Bud32